MKRPPFAVLAAILWLVFVNGWAIAEAVLSGAFADYTVRQWAQQTGGWFELVLIIVGLSLMQRWALLLLALDVVVVLARLAQQTPTLDVIISSLSTYAIVGVLTVPYWGRMAWTLGPPKTPQGER